MTAGPTGQRPGGTLRACYLIVDALADTGDRGRSVRNRRAGEGATDEETYRCLDAAVDVIRLLAVVRALTVALVP